MLHSQLVSVWLELFFVLAGTKTFGCVAVFTGEQSKISPFRHILDWSRKNLGTEAKDLIVL